MVNQTKGLHHKSLRKRELDGEYLYIENSSQESFKIFYDKFIYVIVILAPLTNLPQLFSVWYLQNASGVSALSWFAFSAISITWILYGILHKDKHILYMNIALMIIQTLIAIGAILYS